MENFDTKRLPVKPDDVAPDGSDVRILLQLKRGSMAHFEIAPGAISIAVAHKTIEEIWAIEAEKRRRKSNKTTTERLSA